MTVLTQRIVMLSGVLAAALVIVHASAPGESLPPRQPLAQLSSTVGRWQSAGDVAIDDDSLKVLNADDYVSRAYINGRRDVDLFIAYYSSQRQGGTMHSPLNCLPATGWQPMTAGMVVIDAHPAPITASRVVIQKGLDRQLVLYWYQSHGRTIGSEYASKAYLVLDSIRLHRSDAALVRVVAADADDASATDFIRTLRPMLQRFIPD